MTRTVTLHVEGFAARSLDRLIRGRDVPIDGVFRTAVLYYLNDRDAEQPAWRAPRFRPSEVRGKELEVTFDYETWTALEEESGRQRVRPEDLAVHALLYYVADLQRGRVGERLADALDEPRARGPADRDT
jgi:hypothetical protein